MLLLLKKVSAEAAAAAKQQDSGQNEILWNDLYPTNEIPAASGRLQQHQNDRISISSVIIIKERVESNSGELR